MPTEAQWEYACRAGTTTALHFGETLNGFSANCDGTKPFGTNEGPNLGSTTRVGAYKPNAFGLFDMHGNVREWCRDWYATKTDDLEEKDPERSAKEMENRRVLRGGAWSAPAKECRSAWRVNYVMPETRINYDGFRVIMPVR